MNRHARAPAHSPCPSARTRPWPRACRRPSSCPSPPERDAAVGFGPKRYVAHGGGENGRPEAARLTNDGRRALGLAGLEQAVRGRDPGQGLFARTPSDEADGGADAAREGFELG